MANKNTSTLRRVPEQTRGQQSVDSILQAAAELIGLEGADKLSMTGLAKQAGMSKPALYRYFANKQAIFQELAKRMFQENNDLLFAGMADNNTDLPQRFRQVIGDYAKLQKTQPYRSHLRAAISADPILASMDIADSRQNARALAKHLVQIAESKQVIIGHTGLEQRLFLLMICIDNVGLTCSLLEETEAESLIDEFTKMALISIGFAV